MYTVSIDFGAGSVDYSAYLEGRYPVRRKRAIHNGLKPTISTCRFAMKRNTSLANAFLTASADPVVTILRDGAAYFKGTARRTVKITVGVMALEALEVEVVGPLYRMDSRLCTVSSSWASYTVSNPASKSTSILHQLFYAAGYTDAELDFASIPVTIDRYVIDGTKSTAYRTMIETVLRDVCWTVYEGPDGILRLYDLAPATITTTADLTSGAGGNIAGGYELARSEMASEAVDVTYWTRETKAGAVLHEDTSGGTASQPCTITLAAGSYYPTGAESGKSIRAKFSVKDRELIAADSPALDWAHTGDVVLQDSTVDGQGMLLRFYSATGGVITRLKITGNALLKADQVKVEKEIVAATDEREEIESEIITAKTDAERLANARALWHQYGQWRYSFRQITSGNTMPEDAIYPGDDVYPGDAAGYPVSGGLNPGEYAAVDEAEILGASQTVRIVEVVDGDDPKAFSILCEGVSTYTAVSLVSERTGRVSPQTPRMNPATKPIATLSDAVDFDGQYGIFGGLRYVGTMPSTWARDDAGQTSGEVQTAIPVYVPSYLGAHLDTEPATHKNGNTYLRYSATSGTTYRGVFLSDGSTWTRTTDPAHIIKAARDIIDICQLYNVDGTATLYGVEADYGITSSIDVAHIKAAIIDMLRVGDLSISGLLTSPIFRTTDVQDGDTITPVKDYWTYADFGSAFGIGPGDTWSASGTFGAFTVTSISATAIYGAYKINGPGLEYYVQAYNNTPCSITSGAVTFDSTTDSTLYLGLDFINLFDGLVRPYYEQLVDGGTFNSKTCASVFISGDASIRITFSDTTTLTINAGDYVSYTGSVQLLDEAATLLVGEKYELKLGTNSLKLTNTTANEAFSIFSINSGEELDGSTYYHEATLSLHCVESASAGSEDWLYDISLHDYSGSYRAINYLKNFTGATAGDFKFGNEVLSGGSMVDTLQLRIYGGGTATLGKDAIMARGGVAAGRNSTSSAMAMTDARTMMNEEGGYMVRVYNRTGAASVKGTLVSASDAYNYSVRLTPVGGLDSVGVVYEDGIADGSYVWVVTGGRAQVRFGNATTLGYFARMSISTDSGYPAAGFAFCEAAPSTPFATDNHFREVGHVNEQISAPGTSGALAWCFVHFN